MCGNIWHSLSIVNVFLVVLFFMAFLAKGLDNVKRPVPCWVSFKELHSELILDFNLLSFFDC